MILFRRLAAVLAAAFLGLGLLGCSGGAGSGDGRVGRFLVTANNDGSLSVFRVDAETGVATAHGAFPSELTSVQGVLAAPDGRTLYAVGNDGSAGKVEVLSLEPRTGRIASRSTTSVANGVASAVLAPGGRHLYVASSSQDGLSQLSVTAGGLTRIGPNLPGDPLTGVAIHPAGRFVYTVGRDTRILQAFARDPATGALTPGPTTQTDEPPSAIAFNGPGTVAYVTLAKENANVQVFDVDSASGGLTFRETVSAGNQPVAIVIDRAGAFAYLANDNSNDVTVFKIDSTSGALAKVQTAAAGRAPRQLAFDPTGRVLYSADFSTASVTSFRIDPVTGILADGKQVRGRTAVRSIAVVAGTGYARPVARFAFAPDSLGIHVYRVVDALGTLEHTETHSASSRPVHAVVDPVRSIVFSVGLDDKIQSYPFGSDAAPSSVTVPDTDAVLQRVVLEPSGQYLFALDNRSVSGLSGRIYTYRIESSGALSAIGTTNTGRNPENLVVHPAGRYLYSLDSFGDTITLFELNLQSGRLTRKQTFTPGRTGSGRGRPLAMAFHPSGRYAYVTLQDDQELVRFHVDESNGFLESPNRLSTAELAGDGRPRHLAVFPSGEQVAVTFWGDAVATFTVNSDFSLAHRQTVSVSQHPSFISVDPAGRFAYVTVKDGTVRLTAESSGALGSPVSTLTGGGDSSFSRAVTIATEIE